MILCVYESDISISGLPTMPLSLLSGAHLRPGVLYSLGAINAAFTLLFSSFFFTTTEGLGDGPVQEHSQFECIYLLSVTQNEKIFISRPEL